MVSLVVITATLVKRHTCHTILVEVGFGRWATGIATYSTERVCRSIVIILQHKATLASYNVQLQTLWLNRSIEESRSNKPFSTVALLCSDEHCQKLHTAIPTNS